MVSMRALECLVVIVDQGSLTKAAAVLSMSQPALSHQIAAIERELGTPVLERLPRGTRPTTAGIAAAAEARIALAAADRAVLAGRRVAAGAGGRIRIACAETMTAWLLVPVLREWRRQFPQVELEVQEYVTLGLALDALPSEKADLTVGPRLPQAGGHVEVLGREEIVVVASPEHRFASWDAVPLSELCCEPLVHHGACEGLAGSPGVQSGHGVMLAGPTLHTISPRTAAQLAAVGMGVAIVPRSALTPAPPSGAMIRSLDPPESRDIVVIVAAPHDALLRLFVRDLKRHGLPDSRVLEPSC
ncbi:MAG TPA: LysR family transcriptional regulator [Trebonia sp.]